MAKLSIVKLLVVAAIILPGAGWAACSWDVAVGWCSTDHGFNEGAVCGAGVAAGAGIGGVPAVGVGAVLGNIWDRTNMMGLAKTTARAGQCTPAVGIAACCQEHNGECKAAIQAHPTEVCDWLRNH
jgi:hypothetical protein